MTQITQNTMQEMQIAMQDMQIAMQDMQARARLLNELTAVWSE
jgi:hypothetical protein